MDFPNFEPSCGGIIPVDVPTYYPPHDNNLMYRISFMCSLRLAACRTSINCCTCLH